LCEDQKERLHQEEHFASIKQPRSPPTKENEAKRRIPCFGGGGSRWRPKPFPSTPVATFGPEPASFQGKLAGFQNPPVGFGPQAEVLGVDPGVFQNPPIL
jgi:hypothetical protein